MVKNRAHVSVPENECFVLCGDAIRRTRLVLRMDLVILKVLRE
jgi:hypothetical protein